MLDTGIAMAGLMVAILTHAAATIWWASKINTTMSFIRDDLNKVALKTEKSEDEHKAMWRRIDEINARVLTKEV